MTGEQLRAKAIIFLNKFDSEGKIKTKLTNICGKTGQYSVPIELFQKRTHRKSRVLISWKTVVKNNLTLAQLETFSGGVVVEFINEDYFEVDTNEGSLFNILKSRLGSDEVVSAMISIRNEDGGSSSQIARTAFTKLESQFTNWRNHIIRRKENISNPVNIGNDKWEGFVFVHIAGGQQNSLKSHSKDEYLFNPACEYANVRTCLDIDLVMLFFALTSVNKNALDNEQKDEFDLIYSGIATELESSQYDSGNLLDYCKNHPSLMLVSGKLYDPIQFEQINVMDFSITKKEDSRNLDLTHDEAVNKDRFYFDNHKNCILTPARPNNIFWSKHLSNMMQQNFSLNEYFEHQEEIVEKRKARLN